ncbi:MAG: hypothetical protein FWE82_05180, partial [Defluviitaleaceae bacterium]|nr:hypothetical protein [Defluviitaleaceae bacterium]
GIKKADGLLLTSASPEHITGAFCLVENGRIDAIYMPAGISNDQIGMKLLTEAAARYQVPVVFLESGSKLVSGDLQITALIPEDKNESMMAVKLSYKNISVMLPGDLSPFAGRHGPADTWRADVAAMPSHGDRSRSEVDAAVILISRGWRYPRWIPDPYDILQNEGTAVFSTYRNGAVTLHINGKTVRVTKMIE